MLLTGSPGWIAASAALRFISEPSRTGSSFIRPKISSGRRRRPRCYYDRLRLSCLDIMQKSCLLDWSRGHSFFLTSSGAGAAPSCVAARRFALSSARFNDIKRFTEDLNAKSCEA